ncbi:transcriptional regulator [Acidovorax sp. NO-1]|uniref:type II toxin-antitoxin system HipA family toxin n=2 Tax=unclassified Acidovorax TaxID=2684926 RepID=UPI00023FCB5A|nr:transcriptional regulator [Acidovorax sp. NO-1]
MNGHFVGTWSLESGGDVLQYDSEWVASPLRRPLSLSLPFTPGNRPHKGDVVRFYFENLLPDSKDIRERVARRYQVGSTDAYTLLREIGRDCVGALQIVPTGGTPPTDLRVQAEPLSDAQVAQVIRSTVQPAAYGDREVRDDFRISIAGAQEKTALTFWQGRWCRPLGATPTTHIFKLPMGVIGNLLLDMRHSVENEWLCAQLVAAFGLPVAHCEMLQFEDQKILGVERFDRRWGQGEQLLRLPQEDMCQATGTSPVLKYEADGGPGVDRIMALLDGSAERERDRYRFFMAQLLFWMLSATDGHAKNFSLFLRPQGAFEMAPLYDVLSVYPMLGEAPGKLSAHRARMAMAVRSKNAHWQVNKILLRHWQAVGARYGIVSPRGFGVDDLIEKAVQHTPAAVQLVQTQLPQGFPMEVAEPIFNGLLDAAQRLGRAFG